MNLSVGITTYNEEKNLPRTLSAVKELADEIIIVDSGSTDRTVEIAQSFQAKVYIEDWKGIGLQKRSVVDKCSGKWILLIDADEEITDPLKYAIQEIITINKREKEVYKIRFKTICFGKRIKYGGWSNFYKVRLFLSGTGQHDDKRAHENFITDRPIGFLKKDINHYTYTYMEDCLHKLNVYSSEVAIQYQQKGKRKSALNIYLGALFDFVKRYFILLGFLDGFEGYLLAKISMMSYLAKYAKLRELNRQNKR
ncbi:MAG: glycosyltransferase family 2 protein [Prevotellaceae bacterium]|jgi:glycosyltransferase involved in cell wall biosynthesis|nr:glycosyltransferase family 2 protein [Prevotellaceae bacterium]